MILHSCYLKFPPGQWGQTYNVVPELSRWPFKPLVWMEPLKPMLLFHEKCKWKAPHSESRLDEFYIHTGLINKADKIHNKKRKVWISRLFIWSDKRSLSAATLRIAQQKSSDLSGSPLPWLTTSSLPLQNSWWKSYQHEIAL